MVAAGNVLVIFGKDIVVVCDVGGCCTSLQGSRPLEVTDGRQLEYQTTEIMEQKLNIRHLGMSNLMANRLKQTNWSSTGSHGGI